MNHPTNDGWDDRVSRHLESQARHIDVYGGDLNAIVSRARRRRQQRRLGGVAALLVVAGIGAGVAISQRDQHATPIEMPEPDTGAVDSSLQWQRLETEQSIGWSQSLAVGADGSLYALSTEPGRRNPNDEYVPTPAHLYTSPDGVSWADAGVPADLWASSLTAGGGRLYAVGTAPTGDVESGQFEFQLASSADNGATWTNSPLPIDAAGLEERYGDEIHVGQAQVAVGASGSLVAAVRIDAWIDPAAWLPDDVDLRWGTVTTATGIDVYSAPADLAGAAATVCPEGWSLQEDAPPGRETAPTIQVLPSGAGRIDPVPPAISGDLWCVSPDGDEATPVWPGDVAGPVSQSFTWEQIGVDPELASYVGGRLKLFVSDDGNTFEEVTVDASGDGLTLAGVQLVTTADGFALVVGHDHMAQEPKGAYTPGPMRVLTSADGRAWSPHPAGDLSGYVRSAGSVGGELAVVVEDMATGGTQLAVSDGGSWTLSSPVDAIDGASSGTYASDIQVGPLGAVAVIQDTPDPVAIAGGYDVQSASGYTLHVRDGNGSAQLVDPTGAVIAETTDFRSDAPGGAFDWDANYVELSVSDPATGEAVASFTAEELESAAASFYDDNPVTTWHVAHSVDGVNWSITPLADLLGETPSQAYLAMTPTHVVVRTTYLDSPDRQVALVGTPAG